VGGQDIGEAEALRGLRPPKIGALDGGGDQSAYAALQGVVDGQGGDGSRMIVQGLHDAGNHACIQKRPGAIVDQHQIRRFSRQGFEAQPHGVLAAGAADDGRGQAQALRRRFVERAVVGMDHHPHRRHRRMGGQSAQGMAQHRTAVQVAPLLGDFAAEAGASSCRHHQGHTPRHLVITPAENGFASLCIWLGDVNVDAAPLRLSTGRL